MLPARLALTLLVEGKLVPLHHKELHRKELHRKELHRTAPQRAAAADARLFDELTEGDLQPVAQAGMPTTLVASGNAGQLLREHAATAGGGSGSSFRVGPLASPWVRLGAAFIDGFVINLIMLPTFVVGILVFMFGDRRFR